MVEHISADLLNAQLDTIISTTCKAKSTPKMYLNYADSVKKNQKPLTTYSMNALAFNKLALTFYTINP